MVVGFFFVYFQRESRLVYPGTDAICWPLRLTREPPNKFLSVVCGRGMFV